MFSSESSNGLIDHRKSVAAVFEVDTIPLVVEVVHVVHVTLDDGTHHVDKEECGDSRENQADEVTGETHIDLTISLK